MAMEDCGEEYSGTVDVRNPSHRLGRPRKIKRAIDSISNLPDEILHHIFSYIPTKFAIRTSVLSKRWRHVWSETPHLSFEWLGFSLESINKTLTSSYSASKITSFHLCTGFDSRAHINSSIEFAMSHKVENLSLAFGHLTIRSLPDFFYTNSSVKQLLLRLEHADLIPRCIVSWTSLRSLSLTSCRLSDESFLKILSGCPILESLSLLFCMSLKYLDLTKSLRLRRLELERRCPSFPAPTQIVAPHIHYLRLRDCMSDPDDLLVKVQTMLETFQNVEKLTLGVNFLQMLSLSKIPSLPLPKLKVKDLTLETRILRSVVPGIVRLLQISPGLQKLTVYTITRFHTLLADCVNSNLDSQDLKQCWKWKDLVHQTKWEPEVVKPKLMASFMELLLANTKTLETLVVRLGNCIEKSRFEELYQMALTLSHNNKVSIVLKD